MSTEHPSMSSADLFIRAEALRDQTDARYGLPFRPRAGQDWTENAVYAAFTIAHVARRIEECRSNPWDEDLARLARDGWNELSSMGDGASFSRTVLDWVVTSHLADAPTGGTPWANMPDDGEIEPDHWHDDCWECAFLVGISLHADGFDTA